LHWHTAFGALDLSTPLFLGILNITPDSFSDGGKHREPSRALVQAQRLVSQGVRMLDVGAESTRPGAAPLGEAQEWERLAPTLKLLGQELSRIPLSLDTRHTDPARRALASGTSVLNDVTGFSDPAMLDLAKRSSCGLIAMRSRIRAGQLWMPDYAQAGFETAARAIQELAEVRDRLLGAGIAPARVLLDPGFGFGTTYQEDLALWEALPRLPTLLNWPVEGFCIGISRKRFLAWRAHQPGLAPKERDALTWEAHTEALELGYRVIRTHSLPPDDGESPTDL